MFAFVFEAVGVVYGLALIVYGCMIHLFFLICACAYVGRVAGWLLLPVGLLWCA